MTKGADPDQLVTNSTDPDQLASSEALELAYPSKTIYVVPRALRVKFHRYTHGWGIHVHGTHFLFQI